MSNLHSNYFCRTSISFFPTGLNGVFVLNTARSGTRGQMGQ
jgi:hypothetical protein